MQPFVAVLATHRIAAAAPVSWLPATSHPPYSGRFTDDAETRKMITVELAYRRHGGIVSADEVVNMLSERDHRQPLSRVARWLVAGSVVSFGWQARAWLPLFQFDPREMGVRPEVTAVIRELSGIFDEWELVSWFASPNTWLGNMAPVAAMTSLPAAVIEAARADRFIARG
jgi:hypothetical protein